MHEYPYANTYSLWPGPNSNTFTAWIARAVPELETDLPATAIGKDYIGSQFSLRRRAAADFSFLYAGFSAWRRAGWTAWSSICSA